MTYASFLDPGHTLRNKSLNSVGYPFSLTAAASSGEKNLSPRLVLRIETALHCWENFRRFIRYALIVKLCVPGLVCNVRETVRPRMK